MPPALIAAGAGAVVGAAGKAISANQQKKAAQAAQAQSGQEFATFYDPLLQYGRESQKMARDYFTQGQGAYGETNRLLGDYESQLRGEISGLGQQQFEQMAEADLRQSLRAASPQVTSILAAVGGRGFSPTRSGSGQSQVGGFYNQLLSQHADRLVGNRLNLAQLRLGAQGQLANIAGFREGQRRYDTDFGQGLRTEYASAMEGLLQAPPGALAYYEQGPEGIQTRMYKGAAQTEKAVQDIKLREAFTQAGGIKGFLNDRPDMRARMMPRMGAARFI